MSIVIVLHLLITVFLVYALFKVGSLVKALLIQIVELNSSVSKLDRRSEVGKLTTKEAQIKYIRLNSIIDGKLKQFSNILANDISKVFGSN